MARSAHRVPGSIHRPPLPQSHRGIPASEVEECSPRSSSAQHILGIPFKDVRAFYSFGKVLGEGVSGRVTRCTDLKTGQGFACKTILKSSLTTSGHVACLRNEVRIMLTVGEHPAVVSLHDVYEDDEAVHLLMDLCEGGDLFERLHHLRHYSEVEAARICRILVSVLQHCNAHGIMHRDLKPENILLASPASNTAVKVADFGQGAFYEAGEVLSNFVGTGYYIAPEVLNHAYGPEADVWSLGVILYILLCGRVPFWGADKEAIFARIQRGAFDLEKGPWQQIAPEAKDLVFRMLCLDPARRITLAEIRNHPWILRHCHLEVQTPTGLSPIRCTPAKPSSSDGPRPHAASSPAGPPGSARQGSLQSLSSSGSSYNGYTPDSSPTSVLRRPAGANSNRKEDARRTASCQELKRGNAKGGHSVLNLVPRFSVSFHKT